MAVNVKNVFTFSNNEWEHVLLLAYCTNSMQLLTDKDVSLLTNDLVKISLTSINNNSNEVVMLTNDHLRWMFVYCLGICNLSFLHHFLSYVFVHETMSPMNWSGSTDYQLQHVSSSSSAVGVQGAKRSFAILPTYNSWLPSHLALSWQ